MSTKRSKRYQEAAKLVTPNKNYSITEAVETMKSFPAPKFDPTVTVSFHLTVDPRKSDQMVRGSVSLPNGTGKNVRVLVFAQGDAAKAAQEAGAEFVGFEDLIKKVQDGFVDFDTAIATPDAMTEVRKVARVLGPRGLMPNPKTGTVTDDTAKAVKEVKAGRVDYKVDKNANISAAVGKLSFSNEGITENIAALIDSVVKARPASAKGAYIESVTVSCAMCPGLPVDTASIAKL
ncbi:50S ribosomal protein L1 [Akkermansia muciniphila]|jgi:large subunit ribosomal protein L1|uniref:Large ribosomal subunit protein uL1 n=1 Tax=Akkermansia muciniphila TaxID=239935 RepID=A0A2N8HAY0_9BACT|nr:50S ribosomal protein L1 [Akkermansia muciniphila]MBT8777752.1 50S ribosomal protein L1 [Akkermansia muciniphila]PNC05286.1 50S ribosomal protein L1 [Akkermansia muciniphila]PNC17021.1 50S ribosomal protein L1 [Akkermansia muciniphila]